MYNVLIVEDDPMARKLMEIFVSTSDQYHLVPSLDSAAMAELYCMTNRVDLILMDVCTAMDANGIETAEKLKKKYPETKIIITSTRMQERRAARLFREAGYTQFQIYSQTYEVRAPERIEKGIRLGVSGAVDVFYSYLAWMKYWIVD